jgi:23S rRNA (guanosine2251-2'-O)-methyltransferase
MTYPNNAQGTGGHRPNQRSDNRSGRRLDERTSQSSQGPRPQGWSASRHDDPSWRHASHQETPAANSSHAHSSSGLEYLEGRHSVIEALAAGMPLKGILVADYLQDDERALGDLLTSAAAKGVPTRTVGRDVLDRISDHGSHQGVIAEARPYVYTSIEALIQAAAGRKSALIVVLDHVTDPGNLGAIIRSAEVVGATGVLIPNRRCAQVTATAYKASAGAVAHLPIAQEANLATSIETLKKAGFWVVGASEHADDDVWHAPMEGRLALVMGAEGDGLSRLVLDRCDFRVRLPQKGQVESLNVAQSATALMYEWLRRSEVE